MSNRDRSAQIDLISASKRVARSASQSRWKYESDDHYNCRQFGQYLDQTSKKYFEVVGQSASTGEFSRFVFPYTHRWTKRYRTQLRAKFYRVATWYKSLPHHPRITFMTTTTKQTNLSIYRQIDLLRDSNAKLKDLIRIDHPNVQILKINQSHKSGYMHTHWIIFGMITRKERSKYNQVWRSTYEAGNKIDFRLVPKSNDVNKITAYIVRYATRDMKLDYLSENIDLNNPSGQFLLDSYIWSMGHSPDHRGVRTWSATRDLSRGIRKPPTPRDIKWLKTGICYASWDMSAPRFRAHWTHPDIQCHIDLRLDQSLTKWQIMHPSSPPPETVWDYPELQPCTPLTVSYYVHPEN